MRAKLKYLSIILFLLIMEPASLNSLSAAALVAGVTNALRDNLATNPHEFTLPILIQLHSTILGGICFHEYV